MMGYLDGPRQRQLIIVEPIEDVAQSDAPICVNFDHDSALIVHFGLPMVCSCLVGRAGVEPATNGLKVRCSTD